MHLLTQQSPVDCQSILRNVYESVVAAEQPPDVIDGRVCYHHQGIAGDPLDIDRPCAIGLFDNKHLLDDPQLITTGVDALFAQRPDVLPDVFNMFRIKRDDAACLAAVQNTHDFHALTACRKPWRPIDVFHTELADGLEFIASDYDLEPVLDF